MCTMRPEEGWKIARTPVHLGAMLGREFMSLWESQSMAFLWSCMCLSFASARLSTSAAGSAPLPQVAVGAALRDERRFLNESSEEYELAVTRRKAIKMIERQARRRTMAA